jgi:hypothetical protein
MTLDEGDGIRKIGEGRFVIVLHMADLASPLDVRLTLCVSP